MISAENKTTAAVTAKRNMDGDVTLDDDDDIFEGYGVTN